MSPEESKMSPSEFETSTEKPKTPWLAISTACRTTSKRAKKTSSDSFPAPLTAGGRKNTKDSTEYEKAEDSGIFPPITRTIADSTLAPCTSPSDTQMLALR